MAHGKNRHNRPHGQNGQSKRVTTDQGTAGNSDNPRPTQRRRSQRPRPPPRVNLADLSSSDESTTNGGTVDLPCVQDTIRVCYIDADGDGRDALDASDEVVLEWWSATVTGVLPVSRSGDIRCVANVSFWPAHKQPRQTSTLLFLRNGLVIDLLDHGSNNGNNSEWRYISRVANNDHQDAVHPGHDGAVNAAASSSRNGDWAARSKGSTTAARAANSRTRHRPKPPVPVVDEHGHIAHIAERVSHVEAELVVLKRNQLTDLELEVVNEVRVETKLGVIDALRRSPGALHVTQGGPDLEAVIQGGTVRWSCKCAMGRFKLFAAAVHAFFCEGSSMRPSAVTFTPPYDRLRDVSGFGVSEINFATAMDLMRFLGICCIDDMKKLVTFGYEASGGRHLRVLGALQDGWTDEVPTLAMFVGSSCVRDSSLLTPSWLPDRTNPSKAGHADNLFFANATWDSNNSCFAGEPSLQTSATGFNEVTSSECSTFKIRWDMEPPKFQRTLSNLAVDAEGVRRGTMVVELPFYRLAPYLASLFNELCDEDRLVSIIQNTT